MKKAIAMLLFCTALTGCGTSQVGNNATGQVKQVVHHTPVVCPNWDEADISLGVMRNGVGSMSTADTLMRIPDSANLALLKEAARTGVIVTVKYDSKRIFTYDGICADGNVLTEAALEK